MREIRSQFESAGEGASGVGNLRASSDLLERQLARRNGTQPLAGLASGVAAADDARAQEDAGCRVWPVGDTSHLRA
jgi:hypothetical protein